MKIKIIIIVGFVLSLVSLATTYSLFNTSEESAVKRVEAEAKMIQAQDIADSFKKGANVFSEELETTQKELVDLRERNKQMEFELQLAKKQEAELQYEIVQKEETIERLETELEEIEDTKVEQRSIPLVVQTAVEEPVQKHHVLRFNIEHDFVVFNMGSQDGLIVGSKVQINRTGSKVAVAQVKKIYDRFAAATLLESFDGLTVQEGDKVEKL